MIKLYDNRKGELCITDLKKYLVICGMWEITEVVENIEDLKGYIRDLEKTSNIFNNSDGEFAELEVENDVDRINDRGGIYSNDVEEIIRKYESYIEEVNRCKNTASIQINIHFKEETYNICLYDIMYSIETEYIEAKIDKIGWYYDKINQGITLDQEVVQYELVEELESEQEGKKEIIKDKYNMEVGDIEGLTGCKFRTIREYFLIKTIKENREVKECDIIEFGNISDFVKLKKIIEVIERKFYRTKESIKESLKQYDLEFLHEDDLDVYIFKYKDIEVSFEIIKDSCYYSFGDIIIL